jgi:hypothetical protein
MKFHANAMLVFICDLHQLLIAIAAADQKRVFP